MTGAPGGAAPPVDLRWGIERRLEFIEFRLYWEGRVNRADLTSVFGISTVQASATAPARTASPGPPRSRPT